MMILGQVNRHETGRIRIGAKRVRIVGRVDKPAKFVVNHRFMRFAHVISRLTVVLDLAVVRVSGTFWRQAKPAVADRTGRPIQTVLDHCVTVAASAWHE